MQKVYLLLRNNVQTGPFTIDELLQQQLKPSDMLWVEGKSNAWAYISEMELHPFIDENKIHNKVLLQPSLPPVDEIEKKAEELRKKTLSFSSRYYYQPKTARQTDQNNLPTLRTGNEINFIDHRKEKHNFQEAFITAIIIILIAGGIYKGRYFPHQQKDPENAVVTKIISGDEHTAKNKEEIKPIENSVIVNAGKQVSLPVAKKQKSRKIPVTIKPPIGRNFSSIEPLTISQKNEDQGALEPVSKIPLEKLPKKEVVIPYQKENKVSFPKEKKITPATSQEKKKTLGEALKDIFKKKKKD